MAFAATAEEVVAVVPAPEQSAPSSPFSEPATNDTASYIRVGTKYPVGKRHGRGNEQKGAPGGGRLN